MENDPTQTYPSKPSETPSWGLAGEIAKYTAVIAIIAFPFTISEKAPRHHLGANLDWDSRNPSLSAGLGRALHGSEFCCPHGIRFHRGEVPQEESLSPQNHGWRHYWLRLEQHFGWMIGGTAVRFRLYTIGASS